MPKLPRLKAGDAETLLLKAGFDLIRTRGSHKIYRKADTRIVVPFHAGKTLHPKLIKQVIKAIEAGSKQK